MNSFKTLGFLSADVEEARRLSRDQNPVEFARVEALSSEVMADLSTHPGCASEGFLLGLGFWMRSIECCQGAVLLVERGFPSAPMSVLRTAFECLFFACALWRKPELADRLQQGHDFERIKQAKAMLRAGAATRVLPSRLLELEAVASEFSSTNAGLTAWEAAVAADLVFEYETAYRGFGIGGAHASLRSLDDFLVPQQDGSVNIIFELGSQRAMWLFGLVMTCLTCGLERHREARVCEEQIHADQNQEINGC